MTTQDDDVAMPWPSPHADLLTEDRDWWSTACLDWPRDRWFGYVAGYQKAADLIATHVAKTGRHQDMLIFPFLMCWRHSMELQLKALIILLRKYHGEPAAPFKTHKIDQLWRVAKPLIEPSSSEDDKRALLNAERVLLQLNQLDPTSEHFRYPILNDGSDTLTNVSRIHIRRFHEGMKGVAAFLDAVDTAIGVAMDERAEYLADMAWWANQGTA